MERNKTGKELACIVPLVRCNVYTPVESDSIHQAMTHFHPHGAVCRRVSHRPGKWSDSSSGQLPPD